MKFTEFGEYFKILRIKHKEVLKDASTFLGVSCSFISAVECGKKSIPEDWFDKLVLHYGLNKGEQNQLMDAIERSAKSIKVNVENRTPTQKVLAFQFQRSFEELDDETAEEILKILNRSTNS